MKLLELGTTEQRPNRPGGSFYHFEQHQRENATVVTWPWPKVNDGSGVCVFVCRMGGLSLLSVYNRTVEQPSSVINVRVLVRNRFG